MEKTLGGIVFFSYIACKGMRRFGLLKNKWYVNSFHVLIYHLV